MEVNRVAMKLSIIQSMAFKERDSIWVAQGLLGIGPAENKASQYKFILEMVYASAG